jgi:hypothetical protein
VPAQGHRIVRSRRPGRKTQDGPVVARHYPGVKRFEWATYLERSGLAADSADVSDWGRRTYFECL